MTPDVGLFLQMIDLCDTHGGVDVASRTYPGAVYKEATNVASATTANIDDIVYPSTASD